MALPGGYIFNNYNKNIFNSCHSIEFRAQEADVFLWNAIILVAMSWLDVRLIQETMQNTNNSYCMSVKFLGEKTKVGDSSSPIFYSQNW